MSVITFSPDYLSSLVEEAVRSPRRRQHRNIHTSYDDPCQRFLNAIGPDSYIRPHRHSLDPKAETLLAVTGRFALITFKEDGSLDEVRKFGSEKYCADGALGVGVELPQCVWHTIVALEPGSVLLELKAGPFNPRAAKEPAPWAPQEQTAEAEVYFSDLKARARL